MKYYWNIDEKINSVKNILLKIQLIIYYVYFKNQI